MQMEKLYTIAGVARVHSGVLTMRFASGSKLARQRVLERAGFKDIQFWDLPNAMNIDEASCWLREQGVMAHMPHGQRRGENGGSVRAIPKQALQQDAHVRMWNEEQARKQAFLARMAEGRARKAQAAREQAALAAALQGAAEMIGA
jgi:hypothetical protein